MFVTLFQGKMTWILIVFGSLCLLADESNQVTIETNRIAWEVDARFLSVALDSHLIAKRWKRFDFKLPRILHMASSFSPAYLRFGGTAADLLVFSEKEAFYDEKTRPVLQEETHCYCDTDQKGQKICEDLDDLYKTGNFTLTGKDWINLNKFSRTVGWKFLFDLNVLRRKGQSWDASNARRLLQFSARLNYNDIAWELGNEPNSFPYSFGVNVTGGQLGQDFLRLKKELSRFPIYVNSTLVGPDINHMGNCPNPRHLCTPLRYLRDVMKRSHGILDAITWHHYYLDGHTASLEDFLSVQVLDSLKNQMDAVTDFVRNVATSNKPLWQGESSSAFGGGTHGLSDRYVGGFLWLDKLGLSAVGKQSVVIRQTFYGGCYALIGQDLLPNPDFWISLLHKRLVGQKVLEVRRTDGYSRLRLYAHCSSTSRGAVTLFGLNLSVKGVIFSLESPLSESKVEHYVLSPFASDITSRNVVLNGELLELVRNETVPNLSPKITDKIPAIVMKPYEMAYWVFVNAKISACM